MHGVSHAVAHGVLPSARAWGTGTFGKMSLTDVCGALIVGGFAGSELSASFTKALARGERGGAILFKRNLNEDFFAVAELTRKIAAACDEPPIIAIDQEGGRVARLGPPFVNVPPMRVLANADGELLELAARAQGVELKALGFSTGFSPVLDVNTNAANPVIGDRAFGSDPGVVSRLGVRYAIALQSTGVFACAKHYPGHGDTALDSHLDLPIVEHDVDRLEKIELAPFAVAAQNDVAFAAMMSAHVVYPAVDPKNPATLSHAWCTYYLREKLGFRGVLFSDDLEMKAIAARMSIEDSATGAIEAGCDALLICSSEDLQTRAFEALVKRAARDAKFRARCEEASSRVLKLRRAYPPKPLARDDLAANFPSAEGIAFSRALADFENRVPS